MRYVYAAAAVYTILVVGFLIVGEWNRRRWERAQVRRGLEELEEWRRRVL